MTEFKLHTDGGARGNPGPAGAGAVIEKDGEVLATISEYLGKQTNNWAEYEALILALRELTKHVSSSDEASVSAYLDSELIVKQLSGEYRVKEPALKEQYARVMELLGQLPPVTFTHVYREDNANADKLANDAMDGGVAY